MNGVEELRDISTRVVCEAYDISPQQAREAVARLDAAEEVCRTVAPYADASPADIPTDVLSAYWRWQESAKPKHGVERLSHDYQSERGSITCRCGWQNSFVIARGVGRFPSIDETARGLDGFVQHCVEATK